LLLHRELVTLICEEGVSSFPRDFDSPGKPQIRGVLDFQLARRLLEYLSIPPEAAL